MCLRSEVKLCDIINGSTKCIGYMVYNPPNCTMYLMRASYGLGNILLVGASIPTAYLRLKNATVN